MTFKKIFDGLIVINNFAVCHTHCPSSGWHYSPLLTGPCNVTVYFWGL